MSATNNSKFPFQNTNEPFPFETSLLSNKALTWGNLYQVYLYLQGEKSSCGEIYIKNFSKREGFLNISVFFQVIQYTLHLNFYIFMSKLCAKQV